MENLNWKHVKAAVLALVVLILLFGSYAVIAPGYTGVLFNTMTGSLHSTGQGLTLKAPFVTRIQSYPVALRTYTMVKSSGEGSAVEDDSIDLPTLEGQHIRQDLSVTYNTSESRAADVFKAFRGADISEIENTFIRRTIITVAQNVSGRMSLTEVISVKRDDLQASIQEKLGIELNKMGFTLDKVNMGASHLPQAIEAQMQQKMAAQQQAQQATYSLQREQVLAKAAVAKAQGEADSRLIRARADADANNLLQRTLSPILIQSEAIQKWNGVLPSVSGGAMPFINLSSLKGHAAE